MKVRQGISSDEVLTLFGEPKSIRSGICGRAPNKNMNKVEIIRTLVTP
jgi:hypothetical protein